MCPKTKKRIEPDKAEEIDSDRNKVKEKVESPKTAKVDVAQVLSGQLETNLEQFKIDVFKKDISTCIEKAESWLLKSGIYILDTTDPNYGAVYYHYDCGGRNYELIYAEATGYIISLLKYLFSLYKDNKLIDFARASGEWIIRFAQKYDGVIMMGLRDNNDIKLAYPFDNAICCKGLLDLYELTTEKKYLEHAEKIANWLVNKALNEDGSVKPEFDIDSGKFMESADAWWKASGSFHSKITMCLLRLYSINKNDTMRDAAMKVCQWTLQQQNQDGSFPSNKYMRSINVHAHCYTIEALLYAYAWQNNKTFLTSAQKAVDWMLAMQEVDGSLRLWYDSESGEIKPSYAISQFIRILLLMYLLDRKEHFIEAAKRASKFLMSLQALEQDSRINGGFYEYATSSELIAKDGQIISSKLKKRKALPSWGTMFTIQSFSILERLIFDSSEHTDLNFNDEVRHLF
jgi:uncharacterized protein YyaL (SSP411 family)